MEVFIKKIREAYPLSDETVRLLLGHTERVVLPKGELLMREGTVAKYTYFIIKGFARGFFHKEDRDITIRFRGNVPFIHERIYVFNCRIRERGIAGRM